MPDPPVFNSEMMTITDAEFRAIRDLVYERLGITLSDQKKTLVVGRLQKIVKRYGFKTFRQYFDMVVAEKTGAALSELANQITTNHTFFFREPEHFDFFKSDILPWMVREHRARNDNDLRIWCAAASSGEEPYTLIITLLEHFGADYKNWNCGLLATDISEKALNTAIVGDYPVARLQGVSPAILKKYFRKIPDGYAVNDQLKKEVTYRKFNLMEKNLPFKKKFDCIWCRNVMIYFDNTTQETLVNKFYDHLAPGGLLFTGHSESMVNKKHRYRSVAPAIWLK
jgi:chemotaxis protein methyltransferase CheR